MMERQEFLKKGLSLLGLTAIAPSLLKSTNMGLSSLTGTDKALDCTVTNAETAGPFPTITPSSLVQSNIVGDRTGVAFTLNITIANVDNNCSPLQGAIVDIWHCDKDGYYSEYGGTPMQQVDYTAYHFLRGRQVTNASGQVSFVSIFPGWYQSRATHIHVHIYNAAGNSLLVTQIAFPEGTNSAVQQVNAATSYGYTKGMNGYTYNAADNVFSDSVSTEMGAITGSVSAGFVMEHTINVNGGTTAILEANTVDFTVQQNYPNPFDEMSKIPIYLASQSKVSLQIFDVYGRLVDTPLQDVGMIGSKELVLERKNLASGNYFYKVIVTNNKGTFEKSYQMIVN